MGARSAGPRGERSGRRASPPRDCGRVVRSAGRRVGGGCGDRDQRRPRRRPARQLWAGRRCLLVDLGRRGRGAGGAQWFRSVPGRRLPPRRFASGVCAPCRSAVPCRSRCRVRCDRGATPIVGLGGSAWTASLLLRSSSRPTGSRHRTVGWPRWRPERRPFARRSVTTLGSSRCSGHTDARGESVNACASRPWPRR